MRYPWIRAASTVVGYLVAASLLSAPLAGAADSVIAATKLKLKRSSSGKSKLVLVVKDPAIPFPASPSSAVSAFDMGFTVFALSTPTASRLPVRLRTPGVSSPTEPSFDVRGTSGKYVHKLRHKTAPDEDSVVKLILWRQGRGLKVIMRDAVLPLDEATGGIALRMRWEESGDTQRLCTAFIGASIRVDKPGSFSGANAPLPAFSDCDEESIAGNVSPALCGDGVISGTEQCDGPFSCDRGYQFGSGPFGSCLDSGLEGECSCCAESGGSTGDPPPCCQPSLAIIFPAPFPFTRYECVPSSCAPPYECNLGDTCLPDETCCGGDGTLCGYDYGGGLISDGLLKCCGSLTCAPDLQSAGYIFRCQPPTACTVNADCITNFCDSGLCND